MNIQLFEDELDRLGGDLSRWPASMRLDAEALLRNSEQARALHADTVRLERSLRAFGAGLVPLSKIAATATRHRQVSGHRVHVQRAAAGALAAAVLAVGVLVGRMEGPGGTAGALGTGIFQTSLRPTADLADDSPDQIVATALDPSDSLDVE